MTALGVGLGFTSGSHSTNPPILIEADPAGGSLALRFGLPVSPSLASLASDISRTYTPGMVESHAVDLRGLRCVSAPADPLVVGWSLERGAARLVEVLPTLANPIVLDLGRLAPEAPTLGLARAADFVALVVRPNLEDIQRTLFTVRTVRSVGANVGLIVIGDAPHHPHEVAEVLGCPLIGVVANDPVMARALVGGSFRPRALTKSVLWRSIEAVGRSLFPASPHGPAPTGRPTRTVAPPAAPDQASDNNRLPESERVVDPTPAPQGGRS